jgi:cell division protein ZapA
MDQLSIKVKIADRDYPLKVRKNEEEHIKQAAKLLNEKIKHFKELSGRDDKQDLLAMAAFDLAVEALRQQEKIALANENMDNRLDYLEDLINTALNDHTHTF